GGVRRIDDGVEFLDPVHAEVRHRAGPALIFMRRQLARTRTRGKILHLVGDDGKRLLLPWRTTGVISPPGIETATPMSECLCLSRAPSVQVTLASGTRWSASASALMTKSLTEIL